MAIATRIDPSASFLFRVELRGIIEGFFRECSGLESTIQVIEDPQLGRGLSAKLPGRIQFANIVLRWGLTKSVVLYQWHLDALQGRVRRMNGAVMQVGPDGRTQVARWNFINGWPSKYTGPSFNSAGNEISVEALEIAHEGLERVM
jgi:phage tail-like protein